MCGIGGMIGWGDPRVLSLMNEVQAHRGPDDRGTYHTVTACGTFVGLASTRLSILDLSDAGHMPMASPDRRYWIVYNGEIYNSPELRTELRRQGVEFRSRTDTEVVLALYQRYGAHALHRLNGMFAFAIWDSTEDELFLARDHFGIKPLYYAAAGDSLAFASEIKALLQVNEVERELDLDALHRYLTFLWVPDPQTILRGIQKLDAGHYARWRNGRLRITRYWNLTFPPAGTNGTVREADVVAEVRERIRAAVARQLLSDVPVGAFLSSGLDSSTIVSFMAHARTPVSTYTIVFPERYRPGEITLDDPAIARRVARQLGTRHTEIVVEPDVVALLPRIVWHLDEPIADPAAIMAYLICRAARESSTVLLSGVGGDELFAGYRKHRAHYLAEHYRRLPSLLRRGLIEPVVEALPSLRGTPLKGYVRLAKKMARSASLPPEDRFLTDSTYLNQQQKLALYSDQVRVLLADADPWSRHRAHFAAVRHADFLHQMLYVDSMAFMRSLNLTYNDKMGMASSVEVRVPLLDIELAEFLAWHVPPRLKLNGGTTKYVLRRAMEGILPREVVAARKAGFGAPVDYWLGRDLRPMVDDLLSADVVKRRGLFRHDAIRRMITEQRSGFRDYSLQLWMLLSLELWQQAFLDPVPTTTRAA